MSDASKTPGPAGSDAHGPAGTRGPSAQDGRPEAPIDDQTRKIRSDDATPGSQAESNDDPMRSQYERDQSSDATAAEPPDVIRQAAEDLESGQVNTDLRGMQGASAERQRELLEREKARTGGKSGS